MENQSLIAKAQKFAEDTKHLYRNCKGYDPNDFPIYFIGKNSYGEIVQQLRRSHDLKGFLTLLESGGAKADPYSVKSVDRRNGRCRYYTPSEVVLTSE